MSTRQSWKGSPVEDVLISGSILASLNRGIFILLTSNKDFGRALWD